MISIYLHRSALYVSIRHDAKKNKSEMSRSEETECRASIIAASIEMHISKVVDY